MSINSTILISAFSQVPVNPRASNDHLDSYTEVDHIRHVTYSVRMCIGNFKPIDLKERVQPILDYHDKLKTLQSRHSNVLQPAQIIDTKLSNFNVSKLARHQDLDKFGEDDFLKFCETRNTPAFDHDEICRTLIFKSEPFQANLAEWFDTFSSKDLLSVPVSFEVNRMQVDIATGLIEGVRYLHRNGVVHGNIFPENVIFSCAPGQDFALPIKLHNSVLADPQYFQALAEDQTQIYFKRDKSVDIFMLGVTLWKTLQFTEITTEIIQSFWNGDSTLMEEHGLISNSKELISQMIAKDDNERFSNLDNVQVIIRQGLNSEVTPSESNPAQKEILKLASLLRDSDGSGWFEDLTLLQVLGGGGFGTVLKGFDSKLGRYSAVKLLVPSPSNSTKTQSDSLDNSNPTDYSALTETKIEREYQNTKDCFHPNLVRLYQYKRKNISGGEILQLFQSDGDDHNLETQELVKTLLEESSDGIELKCIEMELCGNTLSTWLGLNDTEKQGFVEESYVAMFQVRIVHGLVEGLKYLHGKDILHRDLKPGNIFFSRVDGFTLPIKIGDFGLSRYLADNINSGSVSVLESERVRDSTSLTKNIGTPLYRAPEIWNGQYYGKPADIFSLGLVIWETLQNLEDRKIDLFSQLVHKGEIHLVKEHTLLENVPLLISQMTKVQVTERLQSMHDVKLVISNGNGFDVSDSQELECILATCPEGTVIRLCGGIFSGPFIVPRSRITITGQGSEVTVITCPESVTAFAISADFCNISNLSIQSHQEFFGLKVTGHNNSLAGLSVSGGVVVDGERNEVRDMTIADGEVGINFVGDWNIAKEVQIQNMSNTGVHIHGNYNKAQNIGAINTNIGVTLQGNNNTLSNIDVSRANSSKKQMGGVLIHALSKCNLVEGLRCEGFTREMDDYGLFMTAPHATLRNEGNTIKQSSCGPVRIEGEGHNLQEVVANGQDGLMEIIGTNHTLTECSAGRVRMEEGSKGSVTMDNCHFDELQIVGDLTIAVLM